MPDRLDLRRLTNVEDLLDDGIENNSDLLKAAHASPEANESASSLESATASVLVRSTTDPLEIQFAEATLAERLEVASPRLRFWVWVLKAFPPLIFCLAWSYSLVTAEPSDFAKRYGVEDDHTVEWIGVAFGLVISLYWPYLLLTTQKRRSQNQSGQS
jgi:hypothetical protein